MFSELGISAEDWEHTPQAVRTVVLSLQHQQRQIATLNEKITQIDDLKAELVELRERVNQNSRNSSKPPSSDPPHQKPPPSASEPTGRQRGAQDGHRGTGRNLKLGAEVDHIIKLRPVSCRECGHALGGECRQHRQRAATSERDVS